jgi:hypothetical protein
MSSNRIEGLCGGDISFRELCRSAGMVKGSAGACAGYERIGMERTAHCLAVHKHNLEVGIRRWVGALVCEVGQ